MISAAVNVNITGEGHSIFVDATATLGTILSNVLPINIYPCYVREDDEGGSSGLLTLGGGLWGLSVPAGTRMSFSITGVLDEVAPGNYLMGMCGEVPDQDENPEKTQTPSGTTTISPTFPYWSSSKQTSCYHPNRESLQVPGFFYAQKPAHLIFSGKPLIYDLHTHSNFSDGSLSPADLVDRAVENRVDVLAITDHDTIAACQVDAAAGKNIRLIHGIELSTQWETTGIHVLGLNFDPHSAAIQQAADMQTEARQHRAEQIADNLEKQGISNALAGAISFAPGGYLGRPHFARHIVAIGKAKNLQAAFKQYLAAGKAGDVKKTWADIGQVIEWIRAANGIPVLAHPLKYSLTGSKLKRLLQAFKQLGGQGMEVVSGQQTPDQTRSMGNLCAELGLLASCGSDFHSPDTHWAELGRFQPLPSSLKPVWDYF